jgi:hypothetical protein
MKRPLLRVFKNFCLFLLLQSSLGFLSSEKEEAYDDEFNGSFVLRHELSSSSLLWSSC